MSHVDDALIHAWLDGALFPDDPKRVALEKHLEVCDECRARVEAERRIRDRAAEVLQSLAPDAVRVEPFEQMIARRRAERAAAEAGPAAQDDVPGRDAAATPITSAPSRRRRRFIPLAWAASLLMAVSAGWFARAYLPASNTVADGVAEQPAAQSDLAPTAAAAARDAAAEPEATNPAAPAPAAVAGVTRESGAEGAGAAAGRQQAVGNVATQERNVSAAKTEAVTGVTDAAATVRSPEETRKLATAMMIQDTGESKALRVLPAAPPSLATEAGGAVDPALAAVRSADWETVTEAEATERLGRAPIRIDDLPVDSIGAAPWAGGWMVRVVQPLGPAGATAEILQWPVPVALDETAVASRLAGRSGVAADTTLQRADTLQRARARQRAELLATVTAQPVSPPAALPTVQLEASGFRALLRANVSPDSLRALAARIR